MRKVLLFSVILFIVSGGLLTVQWIGYEKLSSASEKIMANQTVEIDVKSNGFSIKQVLHSLPENSELNVKMPADAKEVSCSKGDMCIKGGHSGTVIANGGSITIQYKIPASLSSQSFLLNNGQSSFENVDITNTALLVTDHTKRDGQWISSIEQTAAKQLSAIDFYSFEGKADRPPLFWQKDVLKAANLAGITVFAKESVNLSEESVSVPFPAEEIAAQTVVISPELKPQQLDGLTLIQKESDVKKIRSKMIYDYVKKHFIFPEEEQWLTSFLAVSLYNIQPMHMKAVNMNERIAAVLTEAEQKEWKTALLQFKGKEVNAEKLDKALSAVKNEQTDFFEKNKNIDSPAAPLVFFDGRPVTVEGTDVPFHMKNKEGLIYVPLKETAEVLGYSIQEVSSQEWMMKKEFETYRFYLNENRVLLNEHQYALYETALQNIEGIVYIDKIWFQKIFLVEVQETNTAIHLKSYGL
ncbi:stalk domain-containing protein [Domibacillus iocasae]|uniref:Copper amine oxidase-like N-terminal domain-containing protein n=1 Tax=Domibacillus iocasae TaxID=1714016 RepID=A0A1E7DKX4_9BACI|nr:stalk domain-containing protein [Domibacillus iocasae]OES43714.1 hypothetical protein BA724_11475 [Domibacillus iocasae]